MNPITMKVKPWGLGQGDHVVINVTDFDPAKHEKYEEDSASAQSADPAVGDGIGDNIDPSNTDIIQDNTDNSAADQGDDADKPKPGKKGK